MKRLNIFIDETGDFGFNEKSSNLYGISFVFHDSSDNIITEINHLNQKLTELKYNGMVHMADLIGKRGDYEDFSLGKRQKIFWLLFNFAKRAPIKIKSIFVNKKYMTKRAQLIRELEVSINELLSEKAEYINKYDKVVVYYDNGQKNLGSIIRKAFKQFTHVEHRVNFVLVEKRLFQVADMLTYIDKWDYKYKKKISFTNSEKRFFNEINLREVLHKIRNKKL